MHFDWNLVINSTVRYVDFQLFVCMQYYTNTDKLF